MNAAARCLREDDTWVAEMAWTWGTSPELLWMAAVMVGAGFSDEQIDEQIPALRFRLHALPLQLAGLRAALPTLRGRIASFGAGMAA